MENPGVCTAFLSWGFTDKFSWLGDGQYGLPFDFDYNPKPAFWEMMTTLKGSSNVFLQ
jgi:GH35 family endo-1,4-beta-xylanase